MIMMACLIDKFLKATFMTVGKLICSSVFTLVAKCYCMTKTIATVE